MIISKLHDFPISPKEISMKAHLAILHLAGGINTENITDAEPNRLSNLTQVTVLCDLDGSHDELLEAFSRAYIGSTKRPPPKHLVDHIVAEKARCEHETQAKEAQVSSNIGESLKSGTAKLAKDGKRIIRALCEDSGCTNNHEDNPGRQAD